VLRIEDNPDTASDFIGDEGSVVLISNLILYNHLGHDERCGAREPGQHAAFGWARSMVLGGTIDRERGSAMAAHLSISSATATRPGRPSEFSIIGSERRKPRRQECRTRRFCPDPCLIATAYPQGVPA
jgi:hypothetical protein